MSRKIFPMFPFSSLQLQVLYLSVWSILVHIWIWGEIKVWFHYFASGYSVFPTLFIQRLSSPHFVLVHLLKINWCKFTDLFPGSVLFSMGLCVWIYAIVMLFWLLYSCSIFWNKVMWCLQLCSILLKISLAIQSFVVPWKF